MPTLAGLRRRGYTPEGDTRLLRRGRHQPHRCSHRDGAARAQPPDSDLNIRAPRRMAVLNPLKVVIENFSGERYRPPRRRQQSRRPRVPELAPFHFHVRFMSIVTTSWKTRRADSTDSSPGREVRLRYGYFIRCEEVGQRRLGPGRRAPLHLRSRDAGAAQPPTAGASGQPSTGSPPLTPLTPKSGSTTAYSPSPTPTTFPKARPGQTSSIPTP